MSSWKENNLVKITESSNSDILSADEIYGLLGDGCPLVARDYNDRIIGLVNFITYNFEDAKKYDDFGAWEGLEEEYKDTNSTFICIDTPQGYYSYKGMYNTNKISYVYGADGAYVSRKDNLAMITLYRKNLFDVE